MTHANLTLLARHHLDQAGHATSGRSAQTLRGGHEQALRQTVIALTAGTVLAEHENPGEATLLVLQGRVRLDSAGASTVGTAGDLLPIPEARHSLLAEDDSAVLLTVAKRGQPAG
jgi:quercetin dioxygenase-like cupin family protein